MSGVLGIDPGQKGAVVWLMENGLDFEFELMPLDSEGDVSFQGLIEIITKFDSSIPVVLERAIPFAMGTKHAFNYGRGFACIENALMSLERPVTYIEPGKWSKYMHQGIDANLKPKVKSVVALERLYPKLAKLVPKSPKSKKYHDGVMEALLIAGYGQRVLFKNQISKDDF